MRHEDRLRAAGVDNLSLLAATQTERMIAHLQHQSAAAFETIKEEIGETLAEADAEPELPSSMQAVLAQRADQDSRTRIACVDRDRTT